MSKYINLLVNFFIGIAFFLSGIVKLNDPRGFAYIIEEYLHLAASQLTRHIRYLLPYALVLAVGIATLEVVLGVALLIDWQRFWTLWALLLLTTFFAFLTLYTATSKRMARCGCFGDALHLTPWQSFAKSGALLLMLGGLFWQEQGTPTSLNSYYWVGVALVLALGLGIYTLNHLPLLDFSPYKIGSDLTKLALEDATHNTYFRVWQGDQEATQALLAGNKLLVIAPNPASMAKEELQKLNKMLHKLSEDIQPMLITSMNQHQEVAEVLALPHYTAHPVLLRDMLSTPWGLLLLQKGIVHYKWSRNNLKETQKTLRQRKWLKK